MITLPKPPHPSRASSGCGVEEEVDRGDFALADDDEIDTGIDGWPFRQGRAGVDARRVDDFEAIVGRDFCGGRESLLNQVYLTPEGFLAPEIFCTNSSSSSPARSLTAQKSRPSFDQWRTL